MLMCRSRATDLASRAKRARRFRAVEALLEQLDRDLPIELWVAREIDQAHPALPQALQDFVTADRRRHRCHACA
jgi:hypothetical protein